MCLCFRLTLPYSLPFIRTVDSNDHYLDRRNLSNIFQVIFIWSEEKRTFQTDCVLTLITDIIKSSQPSQDFPQRKQNVAPHPTSGFLHRNSRQSNHSWNPMKKKYHRLLDNDSGTFLLLALFWSGSPIKPNLFKDSALLLLNMDLDLDLDKIVTAVMLMLIVDLLLFLPCLIGFVSPAFQLTANLSSFHISSSSDS